jgi:hypothetical protein
MVYGAHGPREVHLVVLSEPLSAQGSEDAAEEVGKHNDSNLMTISS